jgi:hypothetical protein
MKIGGEALSKHLYTSFNEFLCICDRHVVFETAVFVLKSVREKILKSCDFSRIISRKFKLYINEVISRLMIKNKLQNSTFNNSKQDLIILNRD